MITRGVCEFLEGEPSSRLRLITARDLIILKLNQLTCYIPPQPPSFSYSSSSSSSSPLFSSLHRYHPPLRPFIAIMPSLRRTSSHPSLRSSPYGPTQRTQHPYPHRRSSGPAETTRRRVLADIDWWTVSDGQIPAATEVQTITATEQEQDENVHVEAPVLERTQPEPPTVEDVEESALREESPVVHTTISVSNRPPIVPIRVSSYIFFSSIPGPQAMLRSQLLLVLLLSL